MALKVFIQTDKHGEFYNVNAFSAYVGFSYFGWEVKKFFKATDISDDDPSNVIVGGITTIKEGLKNLGVDYPKQEMDYPTELLPFLSRKIWQSTLQQVYQRKQFGIFIKPRNATKLFPGIVIKSENDFMGILDREIETPIWCSETVALKAEWRCFIRYKKLWDVRLYKGVWDASPDLAIVNNAVACYTRQPASYALDFGLDENNQMVLVEANDGHSLGCYGMRPADYARFLSARWAEITNTPDLLDF